MGFDGQRFSHAPHPMHFSSLTTGMSSTFSRGISLLSASIVVYAGLQRHHLYGSCGALPLAESAGLSVPDGYAEVACPDGVPHLDGCALFDGDGLYGRRGAYLGASCAFGPAVASLEANFRLHEAVEAAAGPEHVVGTCVDAELAGRAVGAEVADRE